MNAANGNTTDVAERPTNITIDRAAKVEEVLRKLSQVPPFSCEGLPNLLNNFTQELATRYRVPQSDLVLACIATAGTVVSPNGKLETGWGKQPVPSNLLVILSP